MPFAIIFPFLSTVAILLFPVRHVTILLGETWKVVIDPTLMVLLETFIFISLLTVTVHLAFLLPAFAVITAVPAVFAVISPFDTVTTLVLLVVHVIVLSFVGLYVTEMVPAFPSIKFIDVLFKEIPIHHTDSGYLVIT